MSRYLSSKYDKLKPYVPGEQPKIGEYIKLNTNEPPFDIPLSVLDAVKKEAGNMMLYSDPSSFDIRNAIAGYYGTNAENVIVTNGSDEVLYLAFLAYCDKNTPAVFPDITYGFYKVFAEFTGIPYTEKPLDDKFNIIVQEYFGAHATVFIANPNAPTGIALGLDKLEKIISENRDSIVVIDEAYVDFGAESAVKLVDRYDNLLVIQTFSKSKMMAGARLGLGIASAEIIEDLNRIRNSINPYNVNRMTSAAGVAMLKEKQYLEDCRNIIINNRKYLTSSLRFLGFEVTDSMANFVFAKHEKISGYDLYMELKNRGILIRNFGIPRIKDYNRITVGTEKQIDILIDNIREILENK